MSENENRTVWRNLREAFSFAKSVLLSRKTKEELEDAKKAMEYCASEGDCIAQYQFYALKYNLETDEEKQKAVSWCEKAAEQGYAPAQYDIALHYLYGDQVTKDMFNAISWMEKSAFQGYPDAVEKLITLYTAGTKIRQNLPRAEYWQKVKMDSEYLQEQVLTPVVADMLTIRPEDVRFNTEPLKPDLRWVTFAELFQPSEQIEVICADRSQSFVIDAGPGTGKTYALIRRINELVSAQGLDADEVVVLSFTNAVVDEVKGRLAKMAEDREGDRYIRNTNVRTFHSLAYWMLKNANMMAEEEDEDWSDWKQVNLQFNKLSYDDCMVKGAELMELHPEIVEEWQYLIVDEIQDINHGKAIFVLSILKACIKYNVPFMFLGDSCQAIYDYLDDQQNTAGANMPSEDFYREIIEQVQERARFCSFEVNHRSVGTIQNQTAPIRRLILEREQGKFSFAVREFRDNLKSFPLSDILEFMRNEPDKTICLMTRSNIDARCLSSELIKKKIDHANVLSDQRGAYPRWMGQIFGGYTEKTISRDSFIELCQKAEIQQEKGLSAWESIQQEDYYAKEIMMVEDLLIALRTHQFDYLFQEKEEKKKLVVSNIHRSKGLEYDYVFIDDNFLKSYDKDMEEMKTLYVAITRAKSMNYSLTDTNVLRGVKRDIFKRGRKFQTQNKKKTLTYIEIVSNNDYPDVRPENFIVSDMAKAQSVIHSLKQNDPLMLVFDKEKNTYAIKAKNTVIGWMSQYFVKAVQFQNENIIPLCLDGLYVDGVFSYIGESNDYRTGAEIKLKDIDSSYGVNRVWNYVMFSGMARASYIDPNKKIITTINRQNMAKYMNQNEGQKTEQNSRRSKNKKKHKR